MSTIKDFRTILIAPESTIRETMEVIDKGAMEIALIVGAEGQLLGTVTDGDIRRAILSNTAFDTPASKIMNRNPIVADVNSSKTYLLTLMRQRQIGQIPILDDELRVVGLTMFNQLIRQEERSNPVVIMAGGLGTRLRPYTEEMPKPLLKVGKKPILEIIIEQLESYNFKNIYVSVNYKKEMIKDYFQDGRQFGVKINYIEEDKPLGTAGAIGLIRDELKLPFVVMNGDLLTKINFESLLTFHQEHGASMTLGVRKYDFQVPYGVLTIEGQSVLSVDEKPTKNFFVNAGVYAVNPEVLDLIPVGDFYNMTDLVQAIIGRGGRVASFPIREYWLDIGQMADFAKAQEDVVDNFEAFKGGS